MRKGEGMFAERLFFTSYSAMSMDSIEVCDVVLFVVGAGVQMKVASGFVALFCARF